MVLSSEFQVEEFEFELNEAPSSSLARLGLRLALADRLGQGLNIKVQRIVFGVWSFQPRIKQGPQTQSSPKAINIMFESPGLATSLRTYDRCF